MQFELIERGSQLNSYLLFVVLFSFSFIAVARNANPATLQLVWRKFSKWNKVDSFGFDEEKLQLGIQSLLFINYLLAFSLCVFLVALPYVAFKEAITFGLLSAISFTALQFITFRIGVVISGEWPILAYLSDVNKQNWAFSGVVYLGIAFIWILNGYSNQVAPYIFAYTLVAFYFWRLIKCWRIASQLQLPWYYLILYLCTLEIVPFIIVWHWFLS
ncbi:MAG: hypothetical protein RLZZ301_450 [Bacteroidota bacterium]|jgi:hypothetical protein